MFGKQLCHTRPSTALAETSGMSGGVLSRAGWPRLCNMLQSLVSLNDFFHPSVVAKVQCGAWHGAECCTVGSETVFGKFSRKPFYMFSVIAVQNWACTSALGSLYFLMMKNGVCSVI